MICDVGELPVYYESYGEGTPILFLHGISIDHHAMKGSMEPVFQNRQGWKRIYFDLPGMGKTRAMERIQDTDGMLEFVVGLINRLIPSGNFLVAGTSYGGLLARGLIYRMPERIDGALLIVPAIISERSRRSLPPKTALARDEEMLAGLAPHERKDFENMATVQDRKVWKRYKAETIPALALADRAFLEKIASHGYRFSFNVDHLRHPFKKPVLVLTGRQDTAVGYRDALSLIENFPRGTFAILDRAGHSLEIEQENVMRCLVNEWLDRVEEYRNI